MVQVLLFRSALILLSLLAVLHHFFFFKKRILSYYPQAHVDLIAQAKSGTGKTGVFAIIALSHIDTCMSHQVRSFQLTLAAITTPQVLILEPTREIAQQSCHVINTLGKYVQGTESYSRAFIDLPGLQCKTFIGGVPLERDAAALRNCHIAVGTPGTFFFFSRVTRGRMNFSNALQGRILQLQEDKRLRAGPIDLVILDEADKLFESPMDEQIRYAAAMCALSGLRVLVLSLGS